VKEAHVQTLTRSRPIDVAVVDDRHAIRAGLEAAIATQPGLVCVGTASEAEQAAPLLYRAPDVLILDYHLPRSNGLRLCRQIERDVVAPAIIIYSAYIDLSLVVPQRSPVPAHSFTRGASAQPVRGDPILRGRRFSATVADRGRICALSNGARDRKGTRRRRFAGERHAILPSGTRRNGSSVRRSYGLDPIAHRDCRVKHWFIASFPSRGASDDPPPIFDLAAQFARVSLSE
jgi:CheY-like chemotaxis protein